jgi:DNA-directed RNA polymerase subunit K/omega
MKVEGAGHGVFNQHNKRTEPAMREFFDRVLQPTEKRDNADNTQ